MAYKSWKEAPVLFRRTPFNRYTLPLLIGVLETGLPSVPFTIVDTLEQATQQINASGRAVLCYSFMTPQFGGVVREVRFLRSSFSRDSLLLFAGGPHASADPEGCVALGFDAVFCGEAERTFINVMRKVSKENSIPEGEIIIDTESPPLPFEDYFPLSPRLRVSAPMELTRGCFYGCTFCQTKRIFKGKVRHRSIASVVKGAKMLMERGKTRIFFISPNALSYGTTKAGELNIGALEELLSALRDAHVPSVNMGIFPSELRPESVTEESLALIKRHCSNRKLLIGIQTGSEKLLARLKRGHSVALAVEATSRLRAWDYLPICDFIFGFPGEDDEDRAANLHVINELAKRYGAHTHAHYFVPLPGTPLWGETPTPLDDRMREIMMKMKTGGYLDGDWERQEKMAQHIMKWKSMGLILV